jgi:hypothetical protein
VGAPNLAAKYIRWSNSPFHIEQGFASIELDAVSPFAP